jgi:hypothetical protein
MQNYYDNYDNYEMEPTDTALSELITNMASTRYGLTLDNNPDNNTSRHFFMLLMTAFVVFSVSARMMDWFYVISVDVNLMDKFLDELYGHTSDDDAFIEELEEPELLEDVSPVIKRYEEKYVDEIASLVHNKLSIERLEALANNYVIENTPNGNVMMKYNSVKESFEYYSDSIIPNRFLDVVARKFVKTYDCVSLYKSLATVQEKDTAVISASAVALSGTSNTSTSTSVFAKFKTYNNPKASTVKKGATKSRPVISSNRYTSCGKIANMQMLKKVDRKMVDKSYAMSFAEYKLSKVDK